MGFPITSRRNNPRDQMSALGQKRTLGDFRLMSALPPKADMDQSGCDVRFVPKADILRCEKCRYSITSSARARNVVGRLRPRTSAVVELTARSNLVCCSTGISAGL